MRGRSGEAARRGAPRTRTLLWHQLLTGAVAVAATGGMATATVWQLADLSPSKPSLPSDLPTLRLPTAKHTPSPLFPGPDRT